VKLLGAAERKAWGIAAIHALPAPGEGTLRYRLGGLEARAKTGSLFNGVSTLSGWVWLRRRERWAEFSIMSRGMSKSDAVAIEDRIVRIIANRASLGTP
jgi:D-alanyl-D-alanine carboxypeptidase